MTVYFVAMYQLSFGTECQLKKLLCWHLIKYVNIAVLIFCFLLIFDAISEAKGYIWPVGRHTKKTKMSLVISVMKMNQGAAGSNKIFLFIIERSMPRKLKIYIKRDAIVFFPAIKIDSFHCISLYIFLPFWHFPRPFKYFKRLSFIVMLSL